MVEIWVGGVEVGIKYIDRYKYLGTVISYNIKATFHIQTVRPKLEAICACLYIVIAKGNLKFNSNLFQLYIQPQFRLLAQLYPIVRVGEKKLIVQMYKRFREKICCFPCCTSN